MATAGGVFFAAAGRVLAEIRAAVLGVFFTAIFRVILHYRRLSGVSPAIVPQPRSSQADAAVLEREEIVHCNIADIGSGIRACQ